MSLSVKKFFIYVFHCLYFSNQHFTNLSPAHERGCLISPCSPKLGIPIPIPDSSGHFISKFLLAGRIPFETLYAAGVRCFLRETSQWNCQWGGNKEICLVRPGENVDKR